MIESPTATTRTVLGGLGIVISSPRSPSLLIVTGTPMKLRVYVRYVLQKMGSTVLHSPEWLAIPVAEILRAEKSHANLEQQQGREQTDGRETEIREKTPHREFRRLLLRESQYTSRN